MQVMTVGPNSKVLMCAEVDGIDRAGHTVEITMIPARNWGSFPLQMVSSGSSQLYSGYKEDRGRVQVKRLPLSNVLKRRPLEDTQEYERKILEGIRVLKKFASDGRFEEGRTFFELSYNEGALEMVPLAEPVDIFR